MRYEAAAGLRRLTSGLCRSLYSGQSPTTDVGAIIIRDDKNQNRNIMRPNPTMYAVLQKP